MGPIGKLGLDVEVDPLIGRSVVAQEGAVHPAPPPLHRDNGERGQRLLHGPDLRGVDHQVDVAARGGEGRLAPQEAPPDLRGVERCEHVGQQRVDGPGLDRHRRIRVQ